MRTQSRRQRGQTAVIALLVMLLLAFIGALFITIVAHNLETQGRSHRTLNADYYAEAGLRFADDQLTSSLDGADWRPAMQFQLATPPTGVRELNRYNAIKGQLIDPTTFPYVNDPDKAYLVQGFTRYNTEGGRFLLRITYDPIKSTTDSPSARYLKIESVGREGTIQTYDPTTYANQPPTRLAATLVAYKPIGITDYARFETNIDRRGDTANLGVPGVIYSKTNIVTPGVFDFNVTGNPANVLIQPYPIITTYGSRDAYMTQAGDPNVYANPLAGTGQGNDTDGTYKPVVPPGFAAVAGGGSLRANMTLRLFGADRAYLNRNVPNAAPPVFTPVQDDIEIAGQLLLDNYNPNINPPNPYIANAPFASDQQSGLDIEMLNNAGNLQPNAQYPSNDPNGKFDTQGGAVRDGETGSNSSDAEGNPRSVARLDPPVIDKASSATKLTRYQDITEQSTPRLATAQGLTVTDPNAGQDGWGQAIYVNNIGDVQRDSASLVGGHTLVDEWLNQGAGGQPAAAAKNGWQGSFYNPPGVDISFGLQHGRSGNNTVSYYGVRLTRSDVDNSGQPVYWTNPDGTSGTTPTMIVSYSDLNASNDPTVDPGTLAGAALAAYKANPNNDVVIYAEGNVRIRPSMVSAYAGEPALAPGEPQRLYPSPGTDQSDDKLPRHITVITNGTAYIEGSLLKGNPDSSITVMARDYVCINTTQFYAGAISDENPQSTQPPRASVTDSTLLDFSPENDLLLQDFTFYNATNYGPGNGEAALYVSGGPSAPGSAQVQFDIVNPATGLGINTTNFPQPQPFDTPILNATFDSLGGAYNTGNLNPSANNGPLTHITFDLSNNAFLTAFGAFPPTPLQLWTRLAPGADQVGNFNALPGSAAVGVSSQDFVQQRAAILPRDVRIEAVLYAQDKSFFVIPGPWFNSDSSDNLDSYTNQQPVYSRYGASPTQTPVATARFPFYDQPVDLRITLAGAVSEARPADISAQTAWMMKWGWIPKYHGSQSSANSSANVTSGFEWSGRNGAGADLSPATGLTIIYDPTAGYPFDAPGLGTAGIQKLYYLRSDIYGRPLPFTPKLPVSTSLLYGGQGNPQSILQ